jgi:hypothetical protein
MSIEDYRDKQIDSIFSDTETFSILKINKL